MKKLFVAATAVATGLAFGATDPSGFIYLQASDGKDEQSFGSGLHWPEGAAPEAGNSYYVPSGLELKTTSGNAAATFAGDVLAVSGSLTSGKSGEGRITVNDLRLLDGSLFTFGGISQFYGTMTVEGTTTVKYPWPDGANWIYFLGQIAGDANATLTLSRTARYSMYPKSPMPDCPVRVSGGWSNFYGTLLLPNWTAVAVMTADAMPGMVTMQSGSYWSFNYPKSVPTPTQVGGLNLGDGATVDFYFYNEKCGGFTVTDTFTHGAAKIRIRNEVSANSTTGVVLPDGKLETDYELIRLTGNAATADFDLSQLILDVPITNAANVTAKYGELPREPHFRLVVKTDGTDKVLCLKVGGVDVDGEDYVHMTTENTTYTFVGCAFNPANASYWSNGEVPEISSENTNSYIADQPLTFCHEGYYTPHLAKYDFSNATFYPLASMYNQATELRVKTIYQPGYKSVSGYPDGRSIVMKSYSGETGAKHHFYGDVIALPQDGESSMILFQVWNSIKQVFHGTVQAECNVIYQNSAYSSSGNRGIFYVYQDLTEAHRGVTFQSNHPKPENQSTFYINDVKVLGGEYTGTAANKWSSTTFASCEMTIEENINFADPTRELQLSGTGSLVVEAGKTFKVDVPITYYGSWTKTGDGEFYSTANPFFYNKNYWDNKHAPQDPYNKVTVAGGTIRAGTAKAFDGVAFTFVDGGAIAVDPAATADGMDTLGLVDTRWATPFTVETTDGKIPFVLAKDYVPTEVPFTAPIATVTAAAAETLGTDAFKFVGRGFKATVAPRTNGDTTVTYVATFERAGLKILLK